MWTQALCEELEPRIPGTLLRSLWWCFVLLKALLGFTGVFVLRHRRNGRSGRSRVRNPRWGGLGRTGRTGGLADAADKADYEILNRVDKADGADGADSWTGGLADKADYGILDGAEWGGRGGVGQTRRTGRRGAYWIELGGA